MVWGKGGGRGGPRSRANRRSVSSKEWAIAGILPFTLFNSLTLSNPASPPSPHAPYHLRHTSLSSSLHLSPPPHPTPPRPPLKLSDAVSAKWFSASGLDIGSDISAPLPPPGGLSRWTFLFVGGAAGVFSRTLTAPFERLKLSAQINAGGGPQVRTNECVACM